VKREAKLEASQRHKLSLGALKCAAPTNFRRKSAPGVTRVHPKRQNHDDTNSIAHLEQETTTLGEFEPGIALSTIFTAERRVPGLAALQTDAAGVRSYRITRYEAANN
jgi:hypothetical protein